MGNSVINRLQEQNKSDDRWTIIEKKRAARDGSRGANQAIRNKSVLTAQTADAEAWTDSPVTGPQPLRTHCSAAELMAALFSGLH